MARVRRTTPQMELSRAERAANILGAFAARPEVVSGRTALLVDDIMTTGATLAECSRMLSRAGAAAVHVLVLARA
jgi:predicted amidophosphoribosyltransferase